MDRFDKFTDDARQALTLAQAEAQRLNHNYIGTEHLLLGLVREQSGPAARVLRSVGVDIGKVRTAVDFIVGRGDRPSVGEVGLTPRAKGVIELAIAEARDREDGFISGAHLLLGIVRQGEGIAAGVLESLGVNLEALRHAAGAVLGGEPAAAARPAPWDARQRITSGSPWEERIGFSRAVRIGDRVVVSGTAPIWKDGSVDLDPEVQARRCLEIIGEALAHAGAQLSDVVRTRIYLLSADDAEAVGRAHAEVFGHVRPASTMVVVAALLDPRWRVEIEAEALRS